MFLNCSQSLGKKALLVIGLILCTSIGMAQVSITGTVTDTTNLPLPGANVIIKGTAIGAQTDFDGNFSIEASTGDVLVISFIGFATKEITLGNETNVSIILQEDTSTLDEVVVVGYGTKSRTKLISAVSTIDEEALNKIPVPNVSNALEGMASGLFVRQGSGEPGFSSSSFEVRNFGAALVIVDGAPGDLNQLDSNEIENISVLKDAAAAAIYGVQGGNGVILITTKKGKIGKPKLTYSNQFTYTSFTSFPDYFTSAQYGQVLNEGLINAGKAPRYTEDELELFRNGTDPVNYPNTDWKGLVIKDWGFQQRHNLNLSGGTEKVRYFVSGGYLNQESNYTADVLSYQQFNMRSNINAKINDNLELMFNMGARRRINEAPAFSAFNIFRELSRAKPIDLAYYPDGRPANPSGPTNIVEGLRDFNGGYYRQRNNNFDAKISLEWKVPQVEGLSIKSYASLVYDTTFSKDWKKSFDQFTLNTQTGEYEVEAATPLDTPSDTKLTVGTYYSNAYVLQESINYERSFGDHNVSALLLAEVQKRQGEDVNATRQDFQSTAIDQLNAGSRKNQGANGGEFRENRLGFVGRFNYDYQSKYFIESTYRYDGSSRFAPGKEWGLFPSLSLGWRLSEESFFESLKEVVPELKLRASIGTAGYDGNTSYEWLGGFNYSFFYATNNDGTVLTIDNKSLPNRDITWETNTTYDVGLDATLFNRELNLSFDYFFRTREDVLAPPTGSIPNTLGVGVALQNLHEYSNEGFEISTNYKKQLTEDLKITAGINYSKSREKAVFIDEALIEDDFQRSNLTVTGGFTGLRRGFISDGLFQSQEEIDNHPIQDNNGNSTIQPGDIKFKDLDGDGFVNDRDRKVYGQGSKAASNYSLNVGAEYKNFALSVLLTGASGYDLFISGEAQSPLLNAFTGYDYQMDYWTPENTDAAYPRISEGGSNSNNNRESDFWVRDGKHIRFKNINLSYTLPKAITKKTFDEVRFFVTGYNLFIIKDYDEDFDPQLQGSDQGWVYPQTKSITFGINVTL